MGQNWVTTVAPSLRCLRCKGIRKFIFFWLCIVSFVKKNNCENPSSFPFFSIFLLIFFWFFFKWSSCSRRPARWRMKREKDFASGLIVPSDLPDRKKQHEGFREWSHFSRWHVWWRIKSEKGFASGLIVPGDLPDRKKQREGFHEWSHFSKRPARWWKYRERFFF